jgi:hypothetical protein
MKMFNVSLITVVTAVLLLAACKTSKYSSVNKDDDAVMEIRQDSNYIAFNKLKEQEVPTLANRGAGRSAALVGLAFTAGSSAVKKMIANDKKKYTADYDFALTDLYFYDQLSTESAFDPVGMKFKGFRVIRLLENKDGSADTAMIAEFELDTTNNRAYEIINNSIFRLRLKSLVINSTRAKLTGGQKKAINMDFDITFSTSYVNEQGQLFDNVTLGKFYFFVRNAPIDKADQNYNTYYAKHSGKAVDGKSFIVPRSFGYHITGPSQTEKSWSQGAYSISVHVKESTKDKFVTKLLMDNSDKIIDMIGDKAQGALKKD